MEINFFVGLTSLFYISGNFSDGAISTFVFNCAQHRSHEGTVRSNDSHSQSIMTQGQPILSLFFKCRQLLKCRFLNINYGLTGDGNEPRSTVSEADDLTTRPPVWRTPIIVVKPL